MAIVRLKWYGSIEPNQNLEKGLVNVGCLPEYVTAVINPFTSDPCFIGRIKEL